MTFKTVYNAITYPIIAALLAVFAYGMAQALHLNTVVFVVAYMLPFPLNYYLAVTRSKSVPMMLLLTCIFSWLVTLVLAFFPLAVKEVSSGK